MLADWKKKQDQEKEVLGEEYMDYNLVLATAYSLPVGEDVILGELKKLIADNNLPPYSYAQSATHQRYL